MDASVSALFLLLYRIYLSFRLSQETRISRVVSRICCRHILITISPTQLGFGTQNPSTASTFLTRRRRGIVEGGCEECRSVTTAWHAATNDVTWRVLVIVTITLLWSQVALPGRWEKPHEMMLIHWIIQMGCRLCGMLNAWIRCLNITSKWRPAMAQQKAQIRSTERQLLFTPGAVRTFFKVLFEKLSTQLCDVPWNNRQQIYLI